MYGKAVYILLFVVVFSSGINAQSNIDDKNWGKLGGSYASFGSNNVICFQALDGAASYNSKYFYVLGLNYLYPINRIGIETGLEYAKHTITVQANVYPGKPDYEGEFTLLEIPLSVRINFLKYFYINPGFVVDFDVSKSSPVDNQTGIGALLGVGAKYDFNFGFSVFVNPYFKVHTLIPFTSNNYQEHLIEAGIRMGLYYELKHKTNK